jgi:hypothetical protein
MEQAAAGVEEAGEGITATDRLAAGPGAAAFKAVVFTAVADMAVAVAMVVAVTAAVAAAMVVAVMAADPAGGPTAARTWTEIDIHLEQA